MQGGCCEGARGKPAAVLLIKANVYVSSLLLPTSVRNESHLLGADLGSAAQAWDLRLAQDRCKEALEGGERSFLVEKLCIADLKSLSTLKNAGRPSVLISSRGTPSNRLISSRPECLIGSTKR